MLRLRSGETHEHQEPCGRITPFIRAMILVLVVTLGTNPLWTAPAFGQSPDGESKEELSGPRKHLATIIFAGLGGAILGLSTLSFYGRPQDKLANIAIGFAIGVITGTAYVTYKAATRPQEFYGTAGIPFDPRVPTGSEKAWEPAASELALQTARVPRQVEFTGLGYRWEF